MTAAKRAPYGGGSVYYDKSRDRWVGALRLDGRRHKVSGRTQKEAAAKLRALRHDTPNPTRMTVAQYLDWWLTKKDVEIGTGPDDTSRNTAISHRWALGKISGPLGRKRLDMLDAFAVEGVLDQLAAAGYAGSTVRRVRTILAVALDEAVARGMIARNAARLAKLPKLRQPVERSALTASQARAWIAAAEGSPEEAVIVCAVYLGLRPGELLGLTWTNIDLDAGRLRVAESMKRDRPYQGEPGISRPGPTKTRRSVRTVDLPAPVVAALHDHRARQRKLELAASTWDNPTGLVFTTGTGRPVHPANMNRALQRHADRAGIGHVTMNVGRHTAASLLSDAGVPLEQIADLLGHQSISMLEKHYRHRVRAAVDAHVAPLEALLAGS